MKTAPDTGSPAAAAASAPSPATPQRRAFRGAGGLRAVAALVPGITRKAFEKHGFAAANLITDWAGIVGPDLARMTRPLKLKWPRGVETYGDVGDGERGRPGAVLTISVDPAAALDVQYRSAQIAERINGYFGYRAVASIKLVQAGSDEDFAPPPMAAPVAPRRTAAPASAPSANDQIAIIGDEALRAALERLATSIGQRRGG